MHRHFKSWRVGAWALGLIALGLSPQAMAGPWLKAESEHFVIYSFNDEATTKAYMGQLEVYDTVADSLFRNIGDSYYALNRKTEFYYLDTIHQFKAVRPSIPENAFNPSLSCPGEYDQHYSVNEYFNKKYRDEKFISSDLAYLLRSYTNVKINQYFSYRLPNWVESGLTDFFMTMYITPDEVMLGLPFPDLIYDTKADKSTKLYPYADIISGRSLGPKTDYDLVRLQQWVMINYFLTNNDHLKLFLDYLERYKVSGDSLNAFMASTGMKPEDFEGVYKSVMAKGAPYLTYKRNLITAAEFSVTKLPSYGNHLPLVRSALQTCHTDAYGLDLLKMARAAQQKAPNDDLAHLTNDRAEIMHGDPELAVTSLKLSLSRAPANQEAQLLLGQAYLKLARNVVAGAGDKARSDDLYKLARVELAKAYTLNSSSAPILLAYAKAHENLPDFPNDNTLNAVELAQSLTGRDTLYLVKVYILRHDYDKALATLKPLTTSVSKPECKAMLDQMIEHLTKAKTTTFDPKPVFDLMDKYRDAD